MRQAMQKTGKIKKIKLLGIFVTVFMLMGCSAQDTDRSEKEPENTAENYSVKTQEAYDRTAESADDPAILTEFQAEQIIREADNALQEVMKKAVITEEKKTELNMETEGEEGEGGEIDNPYFPVKEHMTLKVRANYYKGQEPIDEIVDAEINRLKVYERGSIYKLQIDIPIDTAAASYFPVMIRYFYVTTDEIYLIWPFYQPEPNSRCIHFPDDDELLLQTFDTEEKLQNKGQIEPVCSEENIEEEDEYCFRSMKQEEDRVTFYRREMKHNGDEAQKDLFVWEKGKGLIKFETGYGPGPMEVSIDEIYTVL